MVHGPPHFGTDPTFGQQDIPKIEEEVLDSRERCEAKGGFWDEEKRECLLVKKEDLPKEEEEPPKVGPDVPEVGEIIGSSLQTVTLPDGRTFSGLNKEEVEQLVRGEAEQKARLEGTEPAGTAQRRAEEQFRLQQQVAQIGQLGKLDPAIQADINLSQAATAGAVGAIPGIIGGAIAGATVGALGGPIGVVGGAVLGAAAGFTSGILANIKEQQRGELQAAKIELTQGLRSLRQLAMLASQDPSNADIYIQQYNAVLTRIHQSRRQTQAEVTGDLNAFMEDGREQLADFDLFLQPGGLAEIYGQKLTIALNTGVPLSINGEDLFLEI